MLTTVEKQMVKSIIGSCVDDMSAAATAVKNATAALTDSSDDVDYTAQETAYNAIEKKSLEEFSAELFAKI